MRARVGVADVLDGAQIIAVGRVQRDFVQGHGHTEDVRFVQIRAGGTVEGMRRAGASEGSLPRVLVMCSLGLGRRELARIRLDQRWNLEEDVEIFLVSEKGKNKNYYTIQML